MSDPVDNQWPLILRLLAAGGFTRGRVRGEESEEPWPDTFRTTEVTWEDQKRTAVELPGGEWLLVRPAFWEKVIGLARAARERGSVPRPDGPPPNPDQLRRELVAHLLRAGSLTDPLVTQAMLQVPRHLFLPHEPVERSYADEAVITRRVGTTNLSSASQPSMVAIMLEQLAIAPGMRVLEIGAGTGYNAALLAELVGPAGHVTTVDIDEDIVDEARANLAAAGYGAVRTVCADGAEGFAPDAPYDRIVLTVGAYDIAPPWREQLVEGGVLLLPLTLGAGEQSIALERRGNVLRSRSAFPCGFIRLRGLMAPPELQVAVNDGGLVCVISEAQGLTVTAVAAALAGPPSVRPLDLPFRFDGWRAWASFTVFCAGHGDQLVQCFDRDGLLGSPGRSLVGLYATADNSIGLLDSAEKRVWAFGGEGAAALLHERLHTFAAGGSHQRGRFDVDVYPAGTLVEPPPGALLLRRPYNELVVWL